MTILKAATTLVLSLIGLVSIGEAQDYRNSVASVDFDYIYSNDPSAFQKLIFVGEQKSEMPDKRAGENELMGQAFVFESFYSDGTKVKIYIDAEFKNKEAAEKEAKRYVPRLGKLPTTLRSGVSRLVVHQGGRDTTAFSDTGLIVVYSENATKRISTNDLEETIFHESVHASWDNKHAASEQWRKAQTQDANFVTEYAKQKPDREDLAESALFAYTLIHHPGRIPAADAAKIKKAIPARIRFVANLIPPNKPIFYSVVGGKTKTAEAVPQSEQPDKAATGAAASKKDASAKAACKIDVLKVGQLADILSNALVLGLDKDEQKVRKFIADVRAKRVTSQQLFNRALVEFKLTNSVLEAELSEFLHCNCPHKADEKADLKLKETFTDWRSQESSTSKSDK